MIEACHGALPWMLGVKMCCPGPRALSAGSLSFYRGEVDVSGHSKRRFNIGMNAGQIGGKRHIMDVARQAGLKIGARQQRVRACSNCSCDLHPGKNPVPSSARLFLGTIHAVVHSSCSTSITSLPSRQARGVTCAIARTSEYLHRANRAIDDQISTYLRAESGAGAPTRFKGNEDDPQPRHLGSSNFEMLIKGRSQDATGIRHCWIGPI